MPLCSSIMPLGHQYMHPAGGVSTYAHPSPAVSSAASPAMSSDATDVKPVGKIGGVNDGLASSALACSYNQQIRPLLDAVDRLRHLKITQEDINLPTIVVVGDQSSGKSSVLESLAGISLPRGQGICTRVPLVMRLQGTSDAAMPELWLEYNDKIVKTSEKTISGDINRATAEIAGGGKGISETSITVVVKKKGVPDLTLVDLPGITRVPVHGQPDDIYDQIACIIKLYITPKESIILNVLSAAVDFPTCESIRMSQQVDRTGDRTLAVVTKIDKHPEGLLEKINVDDVHIGLGYVCVRNRVGDETYEEAQAEEERLFKFHPLLSKINKSNAGITVLGRRLMQIQATIIAKCLPDIVRKINEKLSKTSAELNELPSNLTSVSEAMIALMRILRLVRDSLEKLLVRGDYSEYPDDYEFHGVARLSDLLQKYSARLPSSYPGAPNVPFLMEEIRLLQELKGIRLPNFVPRSAFLFLLKKKIEEVSSFPMELVGEVWDYVDGLVGKILTQHLENYPQLLSSSRLALQNLMERAKERSFQFVRDSLEMELVGDYTCNPDYMKTYSSVVACSAILMKALQDSTKPTSLNLGDFGMVDVAHLRSSVELAEQAFDMRARLYAYWRSVKLRLVDNVALHILVGVKRLVERELEAELADELIGKKRNGVERMLEESPATASKRDRLSKSLVMLRDSKAVVADIMDRINIGGADADDE